MSFCKFLIAAGLLLGSVSFLTGCKPAEPGVTTPEAPASTATTPAADQAPTTSETPSEPVGSG